MANTRPRLADPPRKVRRASLHVPSIPVRRRRQKLKAEIEKLVAPWDKATTEPPFSLPEILVMGIVLNNWACSKQDLHYWMLQTFGHYRQLALRDFAARGDPRRKGRDPFASIASAFDDAFYDLDAPMYMQLKGLKVLQQNVDDHSPDSTAYHGDWKVDSCASARQFLNRHLIPRPKGHFRLMDLPTELRLRIYEFALLFPKSGVEVRVTLPAPPTKFSAFQKDYSQPLSMRRTSGGAYKLPQHHLTSFPPTRHLALLQVSKEVSAEAMPVFFSSNVFVFGDAYHMSRAIQLLPQSRRDHVRHLALSVHSGSLVPFSKAVKMLKTLPNLQELDLWFDETSYKTEKKGMAILPGYWIPGLVSLRTLRGLKAVRLHGDCENVKKALGDEMTKPKKAKRIATRKRKAAASEEKKSKKVKA